MDGGLLRGFELRRAPAGLWSRQMRMEAYRLILLASLAGGGVGALVLWNRSRSLGQGRKAWRGFVVIAVGTVATIVALLAFAQAFAALPALNAAMVTLLSTGWVAAMHSAVRLSLPGWVLSVRAGELAILGSRWSGVREAGYILRSAPLRGLGGPVYLAGLKGDMTALLCGLHAAESVHVWGFLVCVPWFAVWAAQGQWAALVSGVATNGVINVYPVLHLRYVTGRIDRHLSRVRARRPGGAGDGARTTR